MPANSQRSPRGRTARAPSLPRGSREQTTPLHSGSSSCHPPAATGWAGLLHPNTEECCDKPIQHDGPPSVGSTGKRGATVVRRSLLILPAGEAMVLDTIDLPDPWYVVE